VKPLVKHKQFKVPDRSDLASHRRRGRFAAVVMALAWPHAAVWADDDLFFSDLPIVASVSRLPQRLADASASVTVIDRDMIKASGARDLNDVFRLVPGFQTYPNNTDAARVTYHGLTDEDFSPRVQVLIDGRSQYSPLFRNGINWATLPVAIEDIERIEVVRGSNTVSYGSNAFLGVINIVTVDPALVRGVSVGVNYGNQGVRDLTLRSGGRLGESGDFRFTYQSKDDDGLKDQFDWKDMFRSRLFNLHADFWLTPADQLMLSLGHVEARTRLGRLAQSGGVLLGGESPGNPFRYFDQSSTQLQALWRRALGVDSDVQLRYSFTQDRGSEQHVERRRLSGVNYLASIDLYGDQGSRHELEGQHMFSPIDSMRLVWGAGHRVDSLRSDTYIQDRDEVSRRVSRLFANAEWKPLTWFTGNLGAATEYDSMAGRNFSPRLSTSFHLSPAHTIRLGGSRSYRTAGIVDYRGDWVVRGFALADGTPLDSPVILGRSYIGNPDLPQERVDTAELAYLGEWPAVHASLDVRLYRESVKGRLFNVQVEVCGVAPIAGCGNAYTTMPIQDLEIDGLEYQLRWQPFDSTRIVLSQAWTDISSDYRAEALAASPWLAWRAGRIDEHTERSAPRRSSSVLLMQRLPGGVDLSIAGYWMEFMKWTQNTAVDAYRRFDLRLGYPFNVGGQKGEIAYIAQSINGAHGEFKADGSPADRVVDTRQWVSLRLDF